MEHKNNYRIQDVTDFWFMIDQFHEKYQCFSSQEKINNDLINDKWRFDLWTKTTNTFERSIIFWIMEDIGNSHIWRTYNVLIYDKQYDQHNQDMQKNDNVLINDILICTTMLWLIIFWFVRYDN